MKFVELFGLIIVQNVINILATFFLRWGKYFMESYFFGFPAVLVLELLVQILKD